MGRTTAERAIKTETDTRTELKKKKKKKNGHTRLIFIKDINRDIPTHVKVSPRGQHVRREKPTDKNRKDKDVPTDRQIDGRADRQTNMSQRHTRGDIDDSINQTYLCLCRCENESQ